jgi:TPR repeat protein
MPGSGVNANGADAGVVTRDPSIVDGAKKGLEWLMKAAEEGHVEAQYILAWREEKGEEKGGEERREENGEERRSEGRREGEV